MNNLGQDLATLATSNVQAQAQASSFKSSSKSTRPKPLARNVMAGQASALAIERVQNVPTCSPHLMPFHISYTGPAPVKTYLRVKPAPAPTYGTTIPEPKVSSGTRATTPTKDTETSGSQATLVASSSTTSIADDATVTTSSSATLAEVQPNMDTEKTTDLGSRHSIASFRGRSMRGLRVDLPEGYSGLVLRPPPGGSVYTGSHSKSGKPSTPGSTDMEVDDEGLAEEDELIRSLEPVSTFSSFTLWNPDVPPDENRDEYLRSLTEWTKLAAVIHRYEE